MKFWNSITDNVSDCLLICDRYNPMVVTSTGAEEVVSVSVAGQTQSVNGYIPGWMLWLWVFWLGLYGCDYLLHAACNYVCAKH